MINTEKIQYFGSDLSYHLDIGQIIDMHVVTLDSGVQVLRIECLPKRQDEYKTIKTPKTKRTSRRASSKREKEEPDTLAGKVAAGFKGFMQKPMQPPWERRFPY